MSCGDFSTKRERVALGSELRSKNKEDERTKTERKQRERERKRKSNLSFETKLIKLAFALHLKYISEFTTTTTTTTTAATNYYTITLLFLTFFTPTTNSIYFDCVDDFQLRILLYSFFSFFGIVLILLLLLPVKRWLCSSWRIKTSSLESTRRLRIRLRPCVRLARRRQTRRPRAVPSCK